jgi:hypothetical protein
LSEEVIKRVNRALSHIWRFVTEVKDDIGKISLRDLIDEGGINPYMVAALSITNVEDVAKLFIYKRVERSLTTKFGNAIEAFLRDLLGGVKGEKHYGCTTKKLKWICWWDIVNDKEFEEDGKKYRGIVIAVRSGPADIDKDVAEKFVDHIKEAEKNGYRPYIVFTYGKKVFGVAEDVLRSRGLNPKRYLLVGRGLYKQFLGDENIYDYIIDVMTKIFKNIQIDLINLIEDKVKRIAGDLKRQYGSDVNRLLKEIT